MVRSLMHMYLLIETISNKQRKESRLYKTREKAQEPSAVAIQKPILICLLLSHPAWSDSSSAIPNTYIHTCMHKGVNPDFNKGGCLNEKGCTVAKPLSQLLCSCGGGCGRGLPPPVQSAEARAIRIFCDTKIL